MKSLYEYINEQCCKGGKCGHEEEETEKKTISNEKDFRKACEAKFKKVFGDKLDEDKMNKTIDGILKDHKKDVENGDWGKLIGMVNKAFGK